eukprot:m.515068 g.515068  ORF g.515068 m.515068 type:complete len:53 (-) comp21918_c0_seq4:423-581(-)
MPTDLAIGTIFNFDRIFCSAATMMCATVPVGTASWTPPCVRREVGLGKIRAC